LYKIFIVEDDDIIASQIAKKLKAWGCDTKTACDFANITDEAAEYAPSLVLMDISLPFYNGFHWCSELRKTSSVPIIFISSASDNLNIVMAMNMGGDDFIAKPFDLTVLVAKVQALLRRTYELKPQSNALVCRGAVLSLSDSVLDFDGKHIELTKNEYRILHTLLENKGHIVARDAIMLKLWETDSYVDDNTLTVNVNRLRRKLDAAGLFSLITTRKGEGYVVEEDV